MNQRKAGAILSYISMFVSIVVGFINVSVILSFVSKGDYGVYTVMGSLIAVMGIMDFGLAGTITRYYTRDLTLHDEARQENTLALGALIYGAIGVIAVIAGFVLYPLIDHFYSAEFTVAELTLAKRMFVIMMANFTLSITTSVFNSAILAHEKFVFSRIIEIIKTIINLVLVYVVLYQTKDVIYVVIVHTVVNLAAIIVRIYYSTAKLKIKIKLHFFDKELFQALTAFAFFIFLNMIMDRVYWQTDSLILGAVAGAEIAAVYGIAATVNRYYLNFSSNIASVFLPKITAISAKTDDMEEINSIFLRIGRIQHIIIMLILSGYIIFGQEFIHVWVGDGFKNAYAFSLIVMIPLVIPLIQNTGISILQAKNKHAFRSIVYIFIAILNFSATIPLSKLYGGYGAAAATAVSLIFGQGIIINIYYQKKIGLHIGHFFKEILQMTVPMVILGVAVYFLNRQLPIFEVPVMLTARILLLVKIIIYCVLYFVVAALFIFNEYEHDNFGGFLKKILWRAKK